MLDLPDRYIGKTRVRVPQAGFGAAPVGNLYAAMSDEAAARTLRGALEAGFRYFDTAPYYGFGLSERRLGAALGAWEDSETIVVSTKVGRRLEQAPHAAPGDRYGFVDADPMEPVFDYSYDGVMQSFEDSCIRLGRDRIDILYAHDLGQVTHGEEHEHHYQAFCEGGFRAMAELRDAGRVGAIGLGVNEWQICERALHDLDPDCFLLAGRYTLLDQSALKSFLPQAERRQVSVIVGGPFNSGILAADPRDFDQQHYDYKAPPEAVVEKARALYDLCTMHDVPLTAAGLQFPLAHPAVASVIPGLADTDQVEEAAADFRRPLPPALWKQLRRDGLVDGNAPLPLKEAA